MITKETGQVLIERLGGLSFFPKEDRARRDLMDALKSARVDAIAVTVVNEWIETKAEAPKPADLYALIKAENGKTESEQSRRTATCQLCKGIGFTIIERNGLSGARECECRRPAARNAA